MSRHNAVHRTAIVAPDVEIGEGTVIGPFAVILAPCSIGADCWIGPHVVLGTTGEHVDEMVVQTVPDGDTTPTDAEMWFGDHGVGVVIGDRTIIREQSSVQSGTSAPTTIGSDVFLMNKTHVAHDNVLGDRVRMAPGATLGGHVILGETANLGMNAAVHQWRTIGAGAMVGMQAAVVKDVEPYRLVKGTPARPAGINRVLLEREGVDGADIDALLAHYETPGSPAPAAFRDVIDRWTAARRH